MLKEYVSRGLRLCPQIGKRPIIKNWLNSNLSEEDLNQYIDECNFGWILESTDLVVDIDVKNGGSLEAFNAKFDLTPTVITQSGGYHIYLKKPDNFPIKRHVPELTGIEFLSKGSLVQIPGSENGKYKWFNQNFEQKEAPESLLKLIQKTLNTTKQDFKPPSEKDIVNVLYRLNPSMNYSEWIQIGMALHDWDSNLGFALWENWSQGGCNYKPKETLTHWRSFSKGKGISIGTLFHMANYHREESAKPSSLTINPKESETLGLTPSNSQESENIDISSEKSRKWWSDWVYVNSHSGYVNTITNLVYKKEGFDIKNNRFVEKGSASSFVSRYGLIQEADLMQYLPEEPPGIIIKDNIRILNSFNKESIPKSADEYSEDGLKAIDKIKNHIYFLCNDKENGEILLQWLTHNIQFPGRQIRWAPLIQSIQGVGKSFIGDLLRTCLGVNNVGMINPQQVVSQFNGWATDVCVNILEELRIKGHNRFEASNALKNLITDKIIQINKKGVNQFSSRNYTNYICFTNHKDALPVETTDRRWWIIFNKAESVKDIEIAVNQEYASYFKELYDSLNKYQGEIKKFFSEYEITDSFKSLTRAPASTFKNTMIRTEKALTEGFQEISDLLEEEGIGFNSKVVCVNDLLRALKKKHESFSNFSIKACSLILRRLDFDINEKQFGFLGTRKRVWTKGEIPDDVIKKVIFPDWVT